MRFGIRYSTFSLVCAALLACGVSSSAQQIRYEDFRSRAGIRINTTNPALQQSRNVLRLTDAQPVEEATTAYFVTSPLSSSGGKQPVAGGFTTWFQFQIHDQQPPNPGDGIAFIIQNSNGTDATMGAAGQGLLALGAGGNSSYPAQAGALGYAGINNSLVIEFDVFQDAWDPTSNHIAIQTCGTNYNTPVHDPGIYQIGDNTNVQSCLFNEAIDSNIPLLADGAVHNIVITYTPPPKGQTGSLQIWLDPTFFDNTHTPTGPPIMIVPYTINDPTYGLALDTTNCKEGDLYCGSAWVGFSASQPSNGEQQDILGWEFTPHVTTQIRKVIPPGGVPATYPFGAHQLTVTYPLGFSNPNGTTMVVNAIPVDRATFYQTRLLGTDFANEQCIVYQGAGNEFIANGNCIVYSVTCQDSAGNTVDCPNPSNGDIGFVFMYNTLDPVNANNADLLQTIPVGSNGWFSIFEAFYNDGQTSSGGSKGFGGGGGGRPKPRKFSAPDEVGSADFVATFCTPDNCPRGERKQKFYFERLPSEDRERKQK